MRPFRFQLWLTAALAAVLPSLALASLDSWSQGWPEEPETKQEIEAPEPVETSSEEAAEESEWGSWGLKTASGDFFEEEPESVGGSWPQSQQPRRENGDSVYDTASDVRNGPNVYTYVTQNPWTKFDPLGLFEHGEAVYASGKAPQGAKNAVNFVKNSFTENFTDPAGLIRGGLRGEYGDLSFHAVVVGGFALVAATVETGLDIFSGGSTKAPKKLVREGVEAAGEAVVERLGKESVEVAFENSARDVAEETTETVSDLVGGEKLYRVYGGDSAADGAFWTTTNPATLDDPRASLGLPSGGDSGANNTGRFVVEATLTDPSQIVKKQRATELDGRIGGEPEYIIPKAIENKAVEVDNVSGVNPEY